MRYAFLFALLPNLAQADAFCDELWFTRNLIFDRAGYCFGSPLGQAVFDNSNCSTTAPNLSQADRSKVANIKEQEVWAGCRTNTKRTSMTFPAMAWLSRLIDIPVLSEGESACLGYRGPPLPLYAGKSESYPVLATVPTGATLGYAHYGEGPWTYVTLDPQRGGWTRLDAYDAGLCTDFAG